MNSCSAVELSRKMCIQTYTGEAFSLYNPNPAAIHIEDIAHALSNLARFTGHCNKFYSIAEHCVHVASLLPPIYRLEGLLHDAAEAYINDLSSPLKHSENLKGYREIEESIEKAIAAKFGLLSGSPLVKLADLTMLKVEVCTLLSKPLIPEWNELVNLIGDVPGVRLKYWSPKKAKQKFLEAFRVYRERIWAPQS